MDLSAMLTQDHDLNPMLLRSDQLRAKSFMLLADISAQFLQILLPVNYQPRIIQRLVVTNKKL